MDGTDWLKTVLLDYEDALLVQRALNGLEDVETAEVRRDHHADAPLNFFVRFRMGGAFDSPVALELVNDVNIRRAIVQRGEFIDAPLPDDEGWYLMVHAFPEGLGGGCSVWRTSPLFGACTCWQFRNTGGCKHLHHLRTKYPETGDRGEIRKRYAVSRDVEMDFP